METFAFPCPFPFPFLPYSFVPVALESSWRELVHNPEVRSKTFLDWHIPTIVLRYIL